MEFPDYPRPYLMDFPAIGAFDWGYISVAENQQQPLPFEIKRVFWTYYTPNQVVRGMHSHKQLEEIVVAVSGRIEIELEDLQGKLDPVLLQEPSKGLYLPPYCWPNIKFSHNAVLMALCSLPYEADDYIRSYPDFKTLQAEYQAK